MPLSQISAARLITFTRKFDRGLERLLHDDLHWLDVQARSDSLSVSVTQSSLYLVDYCTSVSDVVSRQHLRSASRRQLVVPRHCLSTFGRRAFAVAGPMSWNSLPNSLRESACDDNISDDCFKHSLKTFLFSWYWRTERSRGVYDSALYKSTFTYLLTCAMMLPVECQPHSTCLYAVLRHAAASTSSSCTVLDMMISISGFLVSLFLHSRGFAVMLMR